MMQMTDDTNACGLNSAVPHSTPNAPLMYPQPMHTFPQIHVATIPPPVQKGSVVVKIVCVSSLLASFGVQFGFWAADVWCISTRMAVMIFILVVYAVSGIHLVIKTGRSRWLRWLPAFASGIIPQVMFIYFRGILAVTIRENIILFLLAIWIFVLIRSIVLGCAAVLGFLAALTADVLTRETLECRVGHKIVIVVGWMLCLVSQSDASDSITVVVACFVVGSIMAIGGAASVLYREGTRQHKQRLPTTAVYTVY